MFKKNDLTDVIITDMTNEGEGVGKADGFAFFVKDTLIGDEVRIRVTKVKRSYGYGRLEKVLKPSKNRIEPVCPVSRQCGGCQIQNMSYEAQLEFKEKKVKNNLVRIGGFSREYIDEISEKIMGAGNSFHYRNKAQFPVGTDKDGNTVVGFYAGRTHSIIPCTDCAIGVRENDSILKKLLDLMNRYGISAYDEKTGTGLMRHILLRKGFHTGQLMICFVINGDDLPEKEQIISGLLELQDDLKKKYDSSIESISYSINKAETNVIMGEDYRVIYGKDTIEDTLLGLKFSISPLSFYQVNPEQVEKLYEKAIEFADIRENEEVWDICCGIGTITLAMAKKAAKVHGIEIVPQAIDDARENARRNGITNAEFICAAAEDYLPAHAGDIHADVIVMDPPRKGMDPRALETVFKTEPSKIVYVSCDSATLSRDLKLLCDGGYELKGLCPVDMFPHTVHVETVVSLSLKSDSPKIEVSMKPGEDSLYEPQDKGTYEKIKAYVLEKYGFKVSSLYIAQTKDKCGLDKRLNYNLSKKDDPHVPECPKEKEDAIMDAFRHFGLIE